MTQGNNFNILLVATVVTFTSLIAATYGFGIYLFMALAPAMMRDIGFTYFEMGVITGISQVGFLVFALCSGLLTTILSAFTIMRLSLVLCALALGALYLANSVFVVGLCLVLLAGCAASMWTPMAEATQALLTSGESGKVSGTHVIWNGLWCICEQCDHRSVSEPAWLADHLVHHLCSCGCALCLHILSSAQGAFKPAYPARGVKAKQSAAEYNSEDITGPADNHRRDHHVSEWSGLSAVSDLSVFLSYR